MKTIVQRGVAVLVLTALMGVGGSYFASAQDKKDTSKKDPAKPAAADVGTFELYKDSAGDFRFRLKDDEGTILASSGKGYKAKADCQKVIDTIKKVAAKAKVDDQAK